MWLGTPPFHRAGLLLLLFTCGCDRSSTQPAMVSCENVRQKTSFARSPAWSADGVHIAFVAGRDSANQFAPGIYVTDTLGSPRRRIWDGGGQGFSTPAELAWNPRGDRIAFNLGPNVWTVDIDGTHATQWSSRNSGGAAWLDDDHLLFTQVWYADEPDTVGGLRWLDVRTGQSRALTFGDSAVFISGAPSISPDGSQLAMSIPSVDAMGSATWEICVGNVDGTGLHTVTKLGGQALNPQWRGNRIFFDFTGCLEVLHAQRYPYICGTQSGLAVPWRAAIGDSRVQFGWPFALSPNGALASFVGLDDTGTKGVLVLEKTTGGPIRQLTNF